MIDNYLFFLRIDNFQKPPSETMKDCLQLSRWFTYEIFSFQSTCLRTGAKALLEFKKIGWLINKSMQAQWPPSQDRKKLLAQTATVVSPLKLVCNKNCPCYIRSRFHAFGCYELYMIWIYNGKLVNNFLVKTGRPP